MLDGLDLALRRRPHLGFRVAVKGDDPPALVGQRRAPAFCAAVMRRNHRLGEKLVQFVNQQPGATLGHLVRAAGGRDRSGLLDRFQERDFARAQPAAKLEIKPDR
jgi:hypothetical protein